MKTPLHYRREIPFFYDKSEKEFQQDPYERFDPMVLRQSALHLMDTLWGAYPMQQVLDFAQAFIPESKSIVEIGCGVGRWIASVAQVLPNAQCWGIDYSYQMLKRAQEVWNKGDTLHLNLSRYGFRAACELKGQTLTNLSFGLAKATTLPFADQSQDLILSSFLLDRLDDPLAGLKEMRRVLAPGGKLIIISPLNFSQAKLWEAFYPPVKIYQQLVQLGFEVLEWQDEMIIEEPLDFHGNMVCWKCIALVCTKGNVY